MDSVTSAHNLTTTSSRVPMPPPRGGHRLIFSSPTHIPPARVEAQLIITPGGHSTQAPHTAPPAPSAVIPPRLQELRLIERPTQLIKDYEKRLRATAQFPPNISDSS